MSERPSIYRQLTLATKEGQTFDLRPGAVGVDFYEDLFSPTITAKIHMAVSDGSTVQDDQGAYTAPYEALKLRGGEAVSIDIAPNDPDNQAIQFTTIPLYVNSISNLDKRAEQQFFTLNLYSKEAYENETTFLQKAYAKDARVSDHVQTILNESFPTNVTNQIDTTANKYGFLGNQMKPFQALVTLASKSVPESAGTGGNSSSAGFFFYQTIDGFNFRAVDGLISQEPIAQYFYSEVQNTNIGCDFEPTPELPALKFKIEDFYINKNQNLVNNLRKGTYSSERKFFNPIDFTVKPPQESFTGNDYVGKAKNLGQAFNPQDLSLAGEALKFPDKPSLILSETYDFGTVEKKVSQDFTQNIDDYYSQRKMRYNTLFTQDVSIQVSVNTNLHAGDLVTCILPKTQQCPSDDIDQDQISGIYMIKELRHHFDTRGSYTSMRLIRDTFGLYGTNK